MQDFVDTVLFPILGTALTALIGYIGMKLKALWERKESDIAKRQIAETCVTAVEQIYTDLHGPEKFYKAVDAMTQMLAERGITVSDFEVKMLIEYAVRMMNAESLMPVIQNAAPEYCADCEIEYTVDNTVENGYNGGGKV